MKYWATPEFKALQQAWYQRLQAEGFEDAEEPKGNEMVLKQSAAQPYQSADVVKRHTQEAYFHFIAHKVQETVFTRDVDRLIMSRHAEGRKIRDICAELKEIGLPRCGYTVRVRIRVYEVRWGLRQYTPKQLNHARVG